MKYCIYSPEEWKPLSENAHLACFGEFRENSLNTYDYVLAIFKDDGEICGYVSIIEMDKETAYMQHGGSFPNAQGTTAVVRIHREMLRHLKTKYKSVTTQIENTNIPMIRLALMNGFIINGVSQLWGHTLLSLINDFIKEEVN